MFNIHATNDASRCRNCGREFADHNYVKDSIDKYKCPHPGQDAVYGGFHGGDPRNFHPDGECTTDSERAAHKKACELFDEAEAKGIEPTPEACPSGWKELGGTRVHVFSCPYGLGMNVHEYDQFFEAFETDGVA